MSINASQTTDNWIVQQLQQNNHQILAFVKGIHREIGDSPHKGPVMCKAFSCHDIIIM